MLTPPAQRRISPETTDRTRDTGRFPPSGATHATVSWRPSRRWSRSVHGKGRPSTHVGDPLAEWAARTGFPSVERVELGDPFLSLFTEFVLYSPGTRWKIRVVFDRAAASGKLGPSLGRSTAAWNLIDRSGEKVATIEQVLEGDLSVADMTFNVYDPGRVGLARLPLGKRPNTRGGFGRASHDSWLLDPTGEQLSRLHYATEEPPSRENSQVRPLLLYDARGALVARATSGRRVERFSPIPWSLERLAPAGSLVAPTLHVLTTALLWYHSGYFFLPGDLARHDTELRAQLDQPLPGGAGQAPPPSAR